LENSSRIDKDSSFYQCVAIQARKYKKDNSDAKYIEGDIKF